MNYLYKMLYSTGKQSCIECEREIENGHIQAAQLTDDSHKLEWYHINCLFENCLPKSETHIEGFASLRKSDQIAIKKQIGPTTCEENARVESTEDDLTLEKSVSKQSKRNNGYDVDPASEMEEYTHVYCIQDAQGIVKKYSVTLTKVNIAKDENAFHRIQLLSANDYEYYWIFESWGCVSSKQTPTTKITSYGDRLKTAIRKFETMYLQKTGNNFGALCFIKMPKRFNHIHVEIGLTDKSSLPKLAPRVNAMMQMIADAKQARYGNFEIEPDRIPLGYPTVNQIHAAMAILKDISNLLSNWESYGKLQEASNDFYSMIPHDSESDHPEIINLYMIKKNYEMLHSLLDQYYFRCIDENTKRINMNALYQTLNVDISPLEESSQDFQIIRDVVQRTNSPVDDLYPLQVLEIHKIKRLDEEYRFRKYKDMENHRLLWHGSRLENFVDILLHGLRIAPNGVHSNGSLFGKGIYFADMVSKSAQYCDMFKNNNVGLLLLCEVALGNMQKSYNRTAQQTIPNETYQSVMGVGTVLTESKSIDGLDIASGFLQERDAPATGLLHNEYIVYDPEQVKIKYLVKLNFRNSMRPIQ